MEVVIAFMIFITFLGTTFPMADLPDKNLKVYHEQAGIELLSQDYNVTPFSDIKFRNIVQQKYDYSCGSAALAILLNSYLGEKLSEEQVIQGLLRHGEVEKIQERRAFSLLDMKRFVEVLGYQGGGFKAEVDDLRQLGKPAIVPIEFYGYKHFVVMKGIWRDHVIVADPYLGNSTYTLKRFVEMWNPNIVFIVSDSEVHLNALRLKNEDLRIVDLDTAERSYVEPLPPSLITEERYFIESAGEAIREIENP